LFSIAFPKFRYLHQDMTWNISCQKKTTNHLIASMRWLNPS
jgi:hypothetical protein